MSCWEAITSDGHGCSCPGSKEPCWGAQGAAKSSVAGHDCVSVCVCLWGPLPARSGHVGDLALPLT